jgi:hypothetical protein
MRRSTSRVGKLPAEVLEQVNEKLYEGWGYPLVRKWLFEEVAEVDVPALGLVKGEKFGLVWLRSAKSAGNAGHFCELAVGNWFRGWHSQWVREKLRRGDSMKTIKRAAALTEAAAEESGIEPRSQNRGETASDTVSGGDIIMRSVLIDAISTIGGPASLRDAAGGGRCDRREIAQLANAWARLNQGDVEAEKLKLKTQSAFELACEGLGKEIKDNPEALALFYKMRDVMAAGKKP